MSRDALTDFSMSGGRHVAPGALMGDGGKLKAAIAIAMECGASPVRGAIGA